MLAVCVTEKGKRERMFYYCSMNGELGFRGRYSVCAADSTVAMNRSSVHQKRPDRLRGPPSFVFSGYRCGGKAAESEADRSPPFSA